MGGNLADSINQVLDEIQNRLYDNYIGGEHKGIMKNVSMTTKDRVVKDNIVKDFKDFIDKLNAEFSDVKFLYQWNAGRIMLNSEMQRIHSDVYNKEYTDDCYDFHEMDERSTDVEYFYATPLQEITVKIDYYWERRCSLGCLHRTKRFWIVNLPRIIDLSAYLKVGMPVRTLVKEFIPDFFYDPTVIKPKRGRPKSSCKPEK